MLKRSLLCAILIASVCMSGCSLEQSKEEVSTEELVTEEPANVGYEPSTEIKMQPAPQIVYNPTDKALLTSDGKEYGTIKFNYVQNIGVWDWYNATAVTNGIKNSYALNMEIDATPLLQNQSAATITPTITLLDPNSVPVSAMCSVGWSGYTTKAELYDNTVKKTIEVGLQPYIADLADGCLVKVDLEDTASKIQFDPIYYSIDLLRTATPGQTMHGANEEVPIQAANGAVYTIQFSPVEANQREYYNQSGKVDLYDLEYQIHYVSGPTNNRSVSIFDSYGGNKISPDLRYYVISDKDQTPLEDLVKTASETLLDEKHLYVTDLQSFDVGGYYKYRSNRRIDEGVNVGLDYVRVIVEFPEEKAVRSDEEMQQFNGKYLVFQLPITKHELRKDENPTSIKSVSDYD